jgi:hypothetical protein
MLTRVDMGEIVILVVANTQLEQFTTYNCIDAQNEILYYKGPT